MLGLRCRQQPARVDGRAHDLPLEGLPAQLQTLAAGEGHALAAVGGPAHVAVRRAQRQRLVEVVLALPHQHGRAAAAAGLADRRGGGMETRERRGLAASAAAVGAGRGDVERGASAVAAGQLAAHWRRCREDAVDGRSVDVPMGGAVAEPQRVVECLGGRGDPGAAKLEGELVELALQRVEVRDDGGRRVAAARVALVRRRVGAAQQQQEPASGRDARGVGGVSSRLGRGRGHCSGRTGRRCCGCRGRCRRRPCAPRARPWWRSAGRCSSALLLLPPLRGRRRAAPAPTTVPSTALTALAHCRACGRRARGRRPRAFDGLGAERRFLTTLGDC